MAVTSTYLTARLRLMDDARKAMGSYSGIKPDAAADKVAEFTNGLEILKGKNIGFQFLTVEALLEEAL